MEEKIHVSSMIGILVSLVCLIPFGANSFMIPTIILIVLLLTVLRKWLEQCDKLKENKRSETTCAYTLAVAVFTALVSYCAGCFARRLAGCLAFAAAALLHAVL